MGDNGVLLRLAHCTTLGTLVECSALAWRTVDGLVLWELRRLLEPAGFVETKGLPLKEHIRRNWDTWAAYVELIGLDSSSLQRSAKSLVARGIQAASGTEAWQEHQLTTPGLLCLLLHWSIHRRARDVKDKAIALFRSLLIHTVSPETVASLELHAPQRPDLDEPCPGTRAGADDCLCWPHFCKELAKVQGSDCPQTSLSSVFLLAAVPSNAQCKAVRGWLRELLLAIAGSIDSQYGTWGDGSWQKTSAASMQGRQKQRRISTQLKQWVCSSVKEGRFNTAEGAMQALDSTSSSCLKNWRAADLVSLRYALHQSMLVCRNISFSMDATRLGRPAKEWLFGAVTLLEEGVHGFLPPQVCMVEKYVLISIVSRERHANMHDTVFTRRVSNTFSGFLKLDVACKRPPPYRKEHLEGGTVAKVKQLEDLQLRQRFSNELAEDEVARLDALHRDLLGPLSASSRQANRAHFLA
eukprot:670164-Amphidinium_carterae.1